MTQNHLWYCWSVQEEARNYCRDEIADVVFSRNDHFACQQEYSGVGFFRIGTWSQCGWGIILKNWVLVGLGMFLFFLLNICFVIGKGVSSETFKNISFAPVFISLCVCLFLWMYKYLFISCDKCLKKMYIEPEYFLQAFLMPLLFTLDEVRRCYNGYESPVLRQFKKTFKPNYCHFIFAFLY